MSFSFKKILIPADLTLNTEVAIQKALALADAQTVIHLLYVRARTMGGFSSNNIEQLLKRNLLPSLKVKIKALNQTKLAIEKMAPMVKVHTWISVAASVQKEIETKAREVGADLVVIGKKSNHSLFPFLNTVLPGSIVSNTGAAVLTVKPGCISQHIKTVILPVTGQITQYKLDAMAAICQKNKVKVHLVTFMEGSKGPSEFYASSLLTVYQWLRTHLNCSVEYAVLHGHNRAMAIMKFARQTNADMLLVHPESETRIGWLNSHISDVLPPASKVQVLAVQQPAYSSI